MNERPATIADARRHHASELARGFSWPECPRWHDDRFWFTDMYTSTLKTVGDDGIVEIVVDATGRRRDSSVPIVLGGFGWLPTGQLVVTSMHEKLILIQADPDADVLSVYADLSDLAVGPINDMVVATDGSLYITQLGFDLFNGDAPVSSPILMVDTDGTASSADAVGPLMGANGIGLSADERHLYVAETFADRLLVMERAADGSLSDHRVFAECPGSPDGLGLDADGGVWAALPGLGRVVRFVDGGGATDVVEVPLDEGRTVACLLGGHDRRTLYVTVGVEVYDFEKSAREAQASIWTARVDVGGGHTRP
ncbi:SMP-30/gluconolactonase/LRE family protein [Gordonia terrae]|uniref:Lactone hydrolase n=2 Tax=Gordonia terrae TaxID=2055 RepID=A0AAD0K9Q8_9ACTN|nr:SMP-30/gluconolactonase/LRE family protein [Gordonia terrae]VTR09617.1 Gluconolactonase [Clostridioides difficile]ANY22228.1 lactone hydrolase [Gordonia terrae]AWO82967.1 lactone hydrolase [Gordonia terrae]VTS30093.1 Gluconolactonase [Gordonia terrae]GAB46303.1 putative lactone hydrolase [Gordonia terrae NBRC 100016]